MTVQFSKRGWEDYLYWQQQDKKILKKINTLIHDVARSPHEGLGKPEPLKHALSGFWSRRITDEHRLVYRVVGDVIQIAQARYHYDSKS